MKKKKKIAYSEDLDEAVKAGCGTPGCTCNDNGFFFNGTCHPDSGVEVRYFEGELDVYCAECRKHVIKIQVASGNPKTKRWPWGSAPYC